MTLEQYRALSKEEQELIMTTLQNMEYPVPNKYPFNYWDIEFYYKKRYKERERIFSSYIKSQIYKTV